MKDLKSIVISGCSTSGSHRKPKIFQDCFQVSGFRDLQGTRPVGLQVLTQFVPHFATNQNHEQPIFFWKFTQKKILIYTSLGKKKIKNKNELPSTCRSYQKDVVSGSRNSGSHPTIQTICTTVSIVITKELHPIGQHQNPQKKPSLAPFEAYGLGRMIHHDATSSSYKWLRVSLLWNLKYGVFCNLNGCIIYYRIVKTG